VAFRERRGVYRANVKGRLADGQKLVRIRRRP
jgi:hypothetical protein